MAIRTYNIISVEIREINTDDFVDGAMHFDSCERVPTDEEAAEMAVEDLERYCPDWGKKYYARVVWQESGKTLIVDSGSISRRGGNLFDMVRKALKCLKGEK